MPDAKDPTTSAAPDDAVTAVVPHVARATPARVGPGLPPPAAASAPAAAPAKIPAPETARRSRWPLAAAAVVVVALVAAGVAYFVTGRGDGSTSPQAQVESTITTFVGAIAAGDLPTLRATSCGQLGDYYRQIPDAQFTDVYRSALAQQSIPVVEKVDAVSITDDVNAIAQVTVHTAAAPADSSARSFTLQRQDGSWKVCS
ncbi:hypothetical protein FK531_11210 [Rhodococcus spelaei]|uniref:DUF4878 domain-containing protein n=1 Tax=Rhodococcus spelaei TaxID=2546320 RepID=A0A541BAE3_9NOCA|nr:hypothetical protein [Rhodococcus spelaei]TQF69300.1 hypothetical protein FK531_11210 [Rhodococcus spelaei]